MSPRTAPKPAPPPPNLSAILAGIERLLPDPRCELDFRTPFELLIATELSAQSTDVMVNQVTPELFRRWPDAPALAAADPAEVEAVLRPTGFFRQKTRNAIGTARLLVEPHGGEVPPRMEDVVRLPGGARKRADVVLGTAFGIQCGGTVDTHVLRVTRRWGWHVDDPPEKLELRLMAWVPQSGWSAFGHRVVLFGRHHCKARAPRCASCALAGVCPVARGELPP